MVAPAVGLARRRVTEHRLEPAATIQLRAAPARQRADGGGEQRSDWWHGPACLVAVAVVYGVGAQLVLLFDDPVGQGAAFFPAAGISLAALVLLPRARWPWVLGGVFLAEMIGNLVHGYAVPPSLWWAAANTVEPLIGASLIVLFTSGDRFLVPVRNAIAFLVSAVLVAPAVGAAFGAMGTTLASDHSFSSVWLKWMVGDGLGVLVVAPVILSVRDEGPARSRREQVLLASLVVLAPFAVFRSWQHGWEVSVPLLTVPLLVWTALRHGIRATTWAIAITTLGAHWATLHGYGPFGVDGTAEAARSLTSFQAYLAVIASTTLLLASMAEDLVSRHDFEAALRQAALHDALTGLPNRAQLDEQLAAIEPETPIAVLACDVDGFKLVNDAFGHQAGDQFLVALTQRMSAELPPGGVLARPSGDEFVVVLRRVPAEEAVGIARRMVESVSSPLALGSSAEVRPSMSVGIAAGVAGPEPIDLLGEADAALYEAKRAGRGTVRSFDGSVRAQVRDRLFLEANVADALDSQITCDYQPCFDLRSGALCSVEALARWHHPVHGDIEPNRFVPAAEATGNAERLFSTVLAEALAAWTAWSQQLGTAPPVAVNLSVAALTDRRLPELVEQALERTGVPTSALWLEVTETGFADATAVAALTDLHAMGVSLAIDDFGTGWSSMARLAELPWSALKIDRSFVGGLGTARGVDKVVEATIELAHSLGIEAIAEGVETSDQLDRLGALGCDAVQGFLLGRPVDADAFSLIIRDARWPGA